jgi:NAD(P)-dependent dehydrogenase (short-subunit alcohol dehydrogenase family)
MNDFTERVAIVTGAARGIGFEIARQLLERGAAVQMADIDSDSLAQGAGQLREAFPDAPIGTFPVDVTRKAQVEELVANTVQTLGGLDLLAHSAGVGLEKDFLETTDEEWRRVIDIDLTGSFLCNQAAARVMVENGYGRIVNLASTAGVRGGTGRAAYGAAKGGIITLTRVMAVELATRGVTVNALAPGAIETELVAKMHSPETRVAYTKAIPADRYGTPEETASAAIYLLSEEARYITGHILAVDGGFLAAGVMHKNA